MSSWDCIKLALILLILSAAPQGWRDDFSRELMTKVRKATKGKVKDV